MKIIGLTTGEHKYHIKIMKENNAEIHNMGKWPNRFINEFFKLPNGDIYITESNFYAPIIIKKIIQRKKIKVVNIAASPKIFLTKNSIMKWLINKVDLMLVEGVFGKENIRKIGYKGKTQIIYPTFDKEKFEKVNVKKDKKIKIVTIARFDWKIKGLDILEKAIENIDCEVYVIGKSKYKPKTNKMKMLGELKKEELLEIFRKTNLYVQASRFETFSIATLEAAYSGLPVIVSNNCGVKEFVNEKYIFKNSKELNEILKQNKFEKSFNFEKYEKADKKIKIIF